MYKLISLDLDGTLFNEKRQVSSRNLKAVVSSMNQNYTVVISTGRPPRFTFSQLPEVLTQGYCICYNGAQIYLNKKLVHETCLETVIVEKIIAYGKPYKLAIEVNDCIYANFDILKDWPDSSSMPIEAMESNMKVCKILMINENNLYADVKKEFGDVCQVIATDQNRLIEIMHKNVTKFDGIKWLTQELGMNMSEVIAFGDDRNDLELIGEAGLGVAMGNGTDEVKRISKHITCSNKDDGVAVVLENILGGFYE